MDWAILVFSGRMNPAIPPSRRNVRSGDYITPRLNGSPWFEKPVLMYWGAAIGYAIFGVGEFGARLPSAFAATLCVFFVYFAGRRLWDRTTGLLGRTGHGIVDWILCLCPRCIHGHAADGKPDDRLVFVSCRNQLQKATIGRRWFYAFYASLGFWRSGKGPDCLCTSRVRRCLRFCFSGRRLRRMEDIASRRCPGSRLPLRLPGISPVRGPTAPRSCGSFS